jgi:hypothetical protein
MYCVPPVTVAQSVPCVCFCYCVGFLLLLLLLVLLLVAAVAIAVAELLAAAAFFRRPLRLPITLHYD